jgi:8-oxo-dGTP pyrophosphatase MutT (NUDIX family)
MREPACSDLVPVTTVHENPWFSVRDRAGYFTVDYLHAHVTVLPVIEQGSVVMVRVKRPVLCDCPLEYPGGMGRPQEDPAAVAARELKEETGISVSDVARFQPMAPIAISSTRMPKLVYLFRVDITRAEFDERQAHDDEVEEIIELEFDELMHLMANGRIYVSLPLAVSARFLASRLAHTR